MFIDDSTQHPLGFLFSDILTLLVEAGDAITRIYREGDFGTVKKDDATPLTRADTAAHEIIEQRLLQLAPDLPIISEEGSELATRYTKRGRYAWLVDPLDGTKEFIDRTGEFTVNIALLDGQYPQCGFVYAPMTDDTYFGLGSGMA